MSMVQSASAEEIIPQSIALWNAPGITSPNREYLRTQLEGRGGTLRLRYTADAPVDAFIAPARRDGAFAFGDLLHFTLPAGESHDVTIPINRSPAWSPLTGNFVLTFLPQPGKTIAVQTAEIQPTPFWTLPLTALRHVAEIEPYKVSTYHALAGYRIFGWNLVPLMGGLLVIIGIAVLIITRGNIRMALVAIFIGVIAYQARFAVDLLRFSVTHAVEWRQDGTYDTAGSIYSVAAFIRDTIPAEKTRIFVCFEGSNFYAKLLRYFVYPRRIDESLFSDAMPTHAVVTKDVYWTFEKDVLTCGKLAHGAKHVFSTPDGMAVFSLATP